MVPKLGSWIHYLLQQDMHTLEQYQSNVPSFLHSGWGEEIVEGLLDHWGLALPTYNS